MLGRERRPVRELSDCQTWVRGPVFRRASVYFRIEITVARSGIWVRVWVAFQAMILDSGVAELANTGNRHDFRYRTWPCKNVLRTSVLGASTPGMSQAAITVISGL